MAVAFFRVVPFDLSTRLQGYTGPVLYQVRLSLNMSLILNPSLPPGSVWKLCL